MAGPGARGKGAGERNGWAHSQSWQRSASEMGRRTRVLKLSQLSARSQRSTSLISSCCNIDFFCVLQILITRPESLGKKIMGFCGSVGFVQWCLDQKRPHNRLHKRGACLATCQAPSKPSQVIPWPGQTSKDPNPSPSTDPSLGQHRPQLQPRSAQASPPAAAKAPASSRSPPWRTPPTAHTPATTALTA